MRRRARSAIADLRQHAWRYTLAFMAGGFATRYIGGAKNLAPAWLNTALEVGIALLVVGMLVQLFQLQRLHRAMKRDLERRES